jgi:polyisoprenyl-phosphate glycosyltransferase
MLPNFVRTNDMLRRSPLVSVVAPFYNEGQGVRFFYQSMSKVIDALTDVRFEIVCVDDGSRDDTLDCLRALVAKDARFRVIELSRNFGKEAALTAGIDAARGDAVIPIDADLQDPPELIGEMIATWQAGADVVLARRSDRNVDSVLKRMSAAGFYRLHNLMSSVQIPDNVGDFRLMNRPAVDALKRMPEQQRFMKGLFAWIGFRTKVVNYTRRQRAAGGTKFSGWKLWNFALEGITSFSTAPLRVWTYVGLGLALLTMLYATFIVARVLISGVDVPGYASLLVAILFLGSLQLISVGLLGEYIGRIYLESKQRPPYIVRGAYERNEVTEQQQQPLLPIGRF